MLILVASSIAFCFGVLVACIMATSGRESRKEERRAIDERSNDVYGGGCNHSPKTNPEK